MRRGDVITVAISGDYGKPRPALIVQSDAFNAHPSVIVLPLTTEIHPAPLFRITVHPGRDNGLRKVSQIMIDKITVVPRAKIGQRIGRVEPAVLQTVHRALAGFLGL